MFFSFGCEAAGIGGFDGDSFKTASVAVKSRACASTTGILPVFLPLPQKAAKFRGATFGTHAAQLDVVLVEERHDAVVEQVGGGDRGLAVIQLGECHLRVGVDEGLLVDPADPLERADIEGVPGLRRGRLCAPQ
jgi:hypothetical protein